MTCLRNASQCVATMTQQLRLRNFHAHHNIPLQIYMTSFGKIYRDVATMILELGMHNRLAHHNIDIPLQIYMPSLGKLSRDVATMTMGIIKEQ